LYSKAIDDLLEPIFQVVQYPQDVSGGEFERALDAVVQVRMILDVCYPLLGYVGEVAELANKFKKVIRGDKHVSDFIGESFDEQGDALYYASELATQTGYKLEDIAKGNNRKLRDRMNRGVIKGDGDNR
jgi:NTP pyrophosphatase (non-canonical NTP hydrolase)